MSAQNTEFLSSAVEEFCRTRKMPAEFAATASQHYLPFIEKLAATQFNTPTILAVSGSQGSGKSTFADFIAWATRQLGWNAVNLSIDDFYLTAAERQHLARDVHPLLRTRGVPGTHDLNLIMDTLAALRELPGGKPLALPSFDKLTDDRRPRDEWLEVEGPLDLIVFEGWCVGAPAQPSADLQVPVNELERQEDAGGVWRHWVNEQLATGYQSLWETFDLFAFLCVPSFEQVLVWREEQERRLVAEASTQRGRAMNREQLLRFIQHYQRITEHTLDKLPEKADVIFWLDADHGIERTEYRHALLGQ